MEDDVQPPRSVRDRIALLQQQQSSSSSPQSSSSSTLPSTSSRSTSTLPIPTKSRPTSAASSPRITSNESNNPSSSSRSRAPSSPRLSASHIQNLYNQPGSTTRDTITSPVKGQATSAHSSIIAKGSSPSNSRAASPANRSRANGDQTLEDSLAVQLGGGGRESRQGSVARSHSPIPFSSSFSSDSPRSGSPAPPPPLPRRIGTPANSATSQIRQRSQTIDPSVSPVSPTDSRPPPPQLPPRRSSTLDPLSSTRPTKVTLASSSAISSNPNQNPNPNSNRPLPPPSRSIPASHSSPTLNSAPALPRRKPTLTISNNVSPRTTSSFEPPPRPSITSKPTLYDPLSLPSSSSRAPNPPPSRSNPRLRNKNGSSTISSSSFKIRPIDPRARKRYERLFDQCLLYSENREEEEEEEEEKVDGETVRMIWERSRLGRDTLRNVWYALFTFPPFP